MGEIMDTILGATVVNGEPVLCKAGHTVCEIVDASKLSIPNGWAQAFGKWRGPRVPRQGEAMPWCHVCGAEIQWPQKVEAATKAQA